MIDDDLKDKIEKVFTPVSNRRVHKNVRLVNKYQKCGTYTIDFINNLEANTVNSEYQDSDMSSDTDALLDEVRLLLLKTFI